MVEIDPMFIVAGTAVLVVLTTVLLCGKTLLSSKKLPNEPMVSLAAQGKGSKEASQPKSKKKSKNANKKSVKLVAVEELPAAAPAPAPKKVTLASVEVAAASANTAPAKAPAEKPNKVEKTSNGASGANGVHEKAVPRTSALKPTASQPVAPPSQPVAPSMQESAFSLASFDDSSSDEAWAVVKKPKKKPTAPLSTATVVEEPQANAVTDAIASDSSQPATSTPSEPIDRVTEEVTVPAKKVGAIIGSKGCVKIALQVATGTDIQFPKTTKEGSESTTATITGPAEGVKKAKKAIQDLISKGYSGLLEGEDFRETQVPVHHM
jgi:hypothetical protein